MKATAFLLGMATLGLASISLVEAQAPPTSKPSEIQLKAQKFVALLTRGDFAAAVKDFDKKMTEVLPSKKLEDLWKTWVARLGAVKKQLGARQDRAGKYDIVFVTCQFEKAKFDIKVVFDSAKQISGLFFVQPTSPYKAPAYVNSRAFRETDVKFGADKWQVPGTLTLPVGDGPFPGVVLVHGSGPNDRDETIGPNKVFRDLAWGLASQNIAVIRYDKRTRVHGAKMATDKNFPTVAEEVTDDALAAVKLLRAHKRIDPKNVYVLGHSLGATLAPQLGALDPTIAGLISLAGATLPIEETVVRQFTYLYTLDGPISDANKKELEKIRKQVARINEPNPDNATAKDLLLGAPVAYWLALRDLMPGKVVARVKQPMLILQGERDYQVTMADFKEWSRLLAGRSNVRLKSYPKLNHLFLEGEGKSKPTEYDKEGHVPKEVIDDIAGWIKQR
jgi:dienelactone hydrolase